MCLCNWLYKKNKAAIKRRLFEHLNGSFKQGNNTLLATTSKHLDEYFKDQRTDFDLPIVLSGTAFQTQVWQTLQTLPYDQTPSYLQLDQTLGKDKAVRAVANALSIIIPCHRIIGHNGKLVVYAGGLDTKQNYYG